MNRTVNCDFCNVALVDHAWDCQAESFDYDEPRVGLEPDAPVVEGSLGSWIACDDCAAAVRDGRRAELVNRAVDATIDALDPTLRNSLGRAFLASQIRDLHDEFWTHRLGPPVRIEADQLDLLAREPRYMEEERA